jgi:nitroimidazol reductase NimA-like FMN-containing flavoprotein (pyridoxamine 5'-phosphate oxidase superfamily)
VPSVSRLPLDSPEVVELLALDIPAHLGTLDPDGYPRITPLWFLWEAGAFYMTSVGGRPHLLNLERDPRASLCVDTEDRVAIAGHRPNRQLKAYGLADLLPDKEGYWTQRITRKYLAGPDGEERAAYRATMPRIAIVLRPTRLLALGA